MQEIILVVYLVVSIALIGIILLQQGKGAEMGASFGAGGSNTVFGAAGSGNVLTKTTTIMAILFFAIALSISYLNGTSQTTADAVLDEVVATEQETKKTGIEAELPSKQSGIEAEVAPVQKESATAQSKPAVDAATISADKKAEDKNTESSDKKDEKK